MLVVIGDVTQRSLEGVPEGGRQAQRIMVAQGLAGAHLSQDDGGPHGCGHRFKISDVLNCGGVGQHHVQAQVGCVLAQDPQVRTRTLRAEVFTSARRMDGRMR